MKKIKKKDESINTKTARGRMQLFQIFGFMVIPVVAMALLYILVRLFWK